MTEAKSIVMDAPGAGLSPGERLLASVLLRLGANIFSSKKTLRVFKTEADKISSIYDAISKNSRETRVLTPRIFGIENNSRNWSAAMTVEHLALVNFIVIEILTDLASGEKPPVITIEQVKPDEVNECHALTHYSDSVSSYIAYMDQALPFASAATHSHPWFGPLDAKSWHTLTAMHQGIHRKQLALIQTDLLNKNIQ